MVGRTTNNFRLVFARHLEHMVCEANRRAQLSCSSAGVAGLIILDQGIDRLRAY
jgi:hypothetical protein